MNKEKLLAIAQRNLDDLRPTEAVLVERQIKSLDLLVSLEWDSYVLGLDRVYWRSMVKELSKKVIDPVSLENTHNEDVYRRRAERPSTTLGDELYEFNTALRKRRSELWDDRTGALAFSDLLLELFDELKKKDVK